MANELFFDEWWINEEYYINWLKDNPERAEELGLATWTSGQMVVLKQYNVDAFEYINETAITKIQEKTTADQQLILNNVKISAPAIGTELLTADVLNNGDKGTNLSFVGTFTSDKGGISNADAFTDKPGDITFLISGTDTALTGDDFIVAGPRPYNSESGKYTGTTTIQIENGASVTANTQANAYAGTTITVDGAKLEVGETLNLNDGSLELKNGSTLTTTNGYLKSKRLELSDYNIQNGTCYLRVLSGSSAIFTNDDDAAILELKTISDAIVTVDGKNDSRASSLTVNGILKIGTGATSATDVNTEFNVSNGATAEVGAVNYLYGDITVSGGSSFTATGLFTVYAVSGISAEKKAITISNSSFSANHLIIEDNAAYTFNVNLGADSAFGLGFLNSDVNITVGKDTAEGTTLKETYIFTNIDNTSQLTLTKELITSGYKLYDAGNSVVLTKNDYDMSTIMVDASFAGSDPNAEVTGKDGKTYYYGINAFDNLNDGFNAARTKAKGKTTATTLITVGDQELLKTTPDKGAIADAKVIFKTLGMDGNAGGSVSVMKDTPLSPAYFVLDENSVATVAEKATMLIDTSSTSSFRMCGGTLNVDGTWLGGAAENQTPIDFYSANSSSTVNISETGRFQWLNGQFQYSAANNTYTVNVKGTGTATSTGDKGKYKIGYTSNVYSVTLSKALETGKTLKFYAGVTPLLFIAKEGTTKEQQLEAIKTMLSDYFDGTITNDVLTLTARTPTDFSTKEQLRTLSDTYLRYDEATSTGSAMVKTITQGGYEVQYIQGSGAGLAIGGSSDTVDSGKMHLVLTDYATAQFFAADDSGFIYMGDGAYAEGVVSAADSYINAKNQTFKSCTGVAALTLTGDSLVEAKGIDFTDGTTALTLDWQSTLDYTDSIVLGEHTDATIDLEGFDASKYGTDALFHGIVYSSTATQEIKGTFNFKNKSALEGTGWTLGKNGTNIYLSAVTNDTVALDATIKEEKRVFGTAISTTNKTVYGINTAATVQSAVDVVANGGTITVNTDVNESSSDITVGKDANFDIADEITLTVQSITTSGTDTALAIEGKITAKTLTVSADSAVTVEAANKDKTTYSFNSIVNNGTVTVNAESITADDLTKGKKYYFINFTSTTSSGTGTYKVSDFDVDDWTTVADSSGLYAVEKSVANRDETAISTKWYNEAGEVITPQQGDTVYLFGRAYTYGKNAFNTAADVTNAGIRYIDHLTVNQEDNDSLTLDDIAEILGYAKEEATLLGNWSVKDSTASFDFGKASIEIKGDLTGATNGTSIQAKTITIRGNANNISEMKADTAEVSGTLNLKTAQGTNPATLSGEIAAAAIISEADLRLNDGSTVSVDDSVSLANDKTLTLGSDGIQAVTLSANVVTASLNFAGANCSILTNTLNLKSQILGTGTLSVNTITYPFPIPPATTSVLDLSKQDVTFNGANPGIMGATRVDVTAEQMKSFATAGVFGVRFKIVSGDITKDEYDTIIELYEGTTISVGDSVRQIGVTDLAGEDALIDGITNVAGSDGNDRLEVKSRTLDRSEIDYDMLGGSNSASVAAGGTLKLNSLSNVSSVSTKAGTATKQSPSFTDVQITGALSTSTGTASLKFGNFNNVTIGGIGKSELGGTNNITFGNGNTVKITGNIDSVGKLTLGKSAAITKDYKKTQSKLTVTGNVNGQSSNSTLKFGDESIVEINGNVDLKGGKNIITLGKYGNLTIGTASSNDTGLSGVTSLSLTAGTGNDEEVTYTKMTVYGDMEMSEAANTISLGKFSKLTINGDIDNDGVSSTTGSTITVSKNAQLNVTGEINGLTKLNISARDSKAVVSKGQVNAQVGGAITGTLGNSTVNIGNGATLKASGDIDLKGGTNKITVGKGSTLDATEKNIANVSIFSVSNGNINTTTQVLARDIQTAAGKSTVSIGNYVDATFTGGLKSSKLGSTNTLSIGTNANVVFASALNDISKLTVSNGASVKVKGVSQRYYSELKAGNLIGTTGNDTISIGNYAKVTLGTVKTGNGNDTMIVGKNSEVTTNSMDLGASDFVSGKAYTNKLTVGASSNLTVHGAITGVSNITLSAGTATNSTMLKAYEIDFAAELKNALSVGNNSDVDALGVTFGSQNDIFTIGKNSEVTLGGAVAFGTGTDSMTVGNNANVYIDGVQESSSSTTRTGITGVTTLKIGNGTTVKKKNGTTVVQKYAVLRIGAISGDTCLGASVTTEGKATITVGNHAEYLSGAITAAADAKGNANLTICVGTGSIFHAVNQIAVDKYSEHVSTDFAAISGVTKIITKASASKVSGYGSFFGAGDITGTSSADTYTFGGKTIVTSINMGGDTQDNLIFGKRANIRINGGDDTTSAITGADTITINDNATIAGSTGTLAGLTNPPAGTTVKIGKNVTFIDLGKDAANSAFTDATTEAADNSIEQAAEAGTKLASGTNGWLSASESEQVTYVNDQVDFFQLAEIGTPVDLSKWQLSAETGSVKVTVFSKKSEAEWADATKSELSEGKGEAAGTWDLSKATLVDDAAAVMISVELTDSTKKTIEYTVTKLA